MDFRSLNKFNAIVNTVSGNFLPLTEKEPALGFASTIYSIVSWFIDSMYVFLTLIGLICYLPVLEAVRSGGTDITLSAEGVCLAGYLLYQRKFLRIFIRKINSILTDSDSLRRCIRKSIAPSGKCLKVYALMNISTWMVWELLPLVKILHADRFNYTDFMVTMYFPGAPFTVNVFTCGIFLRTFSAFSIMLKKIGVDVYINYFITLLTAEYRYLEERLADALREKNEILAIKALKQCVIYQCNIMQTGHLLIDIISLCIGLTYINCIFRFCFTAFSVVTIPGAYFTKFLMTVFGIGSLLQVYVLCSCIQDLLEASASVANKAFHEDWHEHNRTVRGIYRIIGLGNQIECRLTAFGIFDLTVPTVATILKQSYSVCLLLMRFQ